jgi:hypothetical protein
MDAGLIC